MFLFQGVQLLACIVVTKQCQLLSKQTPDKMSRESEHHRTTFAACWARSDVINTQVVELGKDERSVKGQPRKAPHGKDWFVVNRFGLLWYERKETSKWRIFKDITQYRWGSLNIQTITNKVDWFNVALGNDTTHLQYQPGLLRMIFKLTLTLNEKDETKRISKIPQHCCCCLQNLRLINNTWNIKRRSVSCTQHTQ